MMLVNAQAEAPDSPQYDGFADALQDAEHMADELLAALTGQTVVAVDQVEFITLRLRGLVHSCRVAFQDGGPS